MHNPDLYEQNNYLHKRDVKVYMEKYTPKMKWKRPSNRVMDIGCADGSVTKILQTFLPSDSKVLGCDISENMVKFAADHYSNDRISFMVLDIASDMPKEMKGTLDKVFSFYTLNWVIDQKRALENIFDLLDEDGECLMVLVAYNPVFDVYRVLENSKWSTWVYDIDKYISPYHDSEEPDKELMESMASIGFVDVNVECKDSFFLFDNKGERKNLMSAICPFEIPKEKHDDFMNDYLQVMDEFESIHKVRTNHSSTDVTLHYKSVMIYARKPVTSELLHLESNTNNIFIKK